LSQVIEANKAKRDAKQIRKTPTTFFGTIWTTTLGNEIQDTPGNEFRVIGSSWHLFNTIYVISGQLFILSEDCNVSTDITK